MHRLKLNLLLAATLLLAGCDRKSAIPAPVAGPRTAGSLIGVEAVGGHSEIVLEAILWWAGLPVKVKTDHGVDLYRIRYWTRVNNRLTIASGLVGVPRGLAPGTAARATVMYLHGTSPDRSDSPSSPGAVEGELPSAIFGGGGYLVLAPDYVGLGSSIDPPAYLSVEATAAASRDLLTAARSAVGARWSPDLYLVGFSQGGHAVALVQRDLEARPPAFAKVRAAAAISGAYDLARIGVPYAIRNGSTLYLAYVAYSYAVEYRRPLDSVVVGRYARILPGLFDGSHSPEAIDAALPKDPRTLFRPDALAAIEGRGSHWFLDALKANQAFDWTPQAPLHLYYGERDRDVSPAESLLLYRRAKARGSDVSLISLGPIDHTPTAMAGVPSARLWFDKLTDRR